MSDLFININFNLNTNVFEIDTNVKQEHVAEIIDTFLRGQIGKGEDTSKPNELDIYTFKMKVDLSFDTINIKDDTGNKSLSDGIFMNLLNQLNGYDKSIIWKN